MLQLWRARGLYNRRWKKELRKKFEEEKGYSEDLFESKEGFYEDYAGDYKYFLLDAGNKNIDEGVENFIKESIGGYTEQFDENYRELLEDEKLEDEEEEE